METTIIGNKISQARKSLNMSQAQLAERLFISAQAVGKWERGESMPDILTFNRMAEILGVDLNYFSENFASTPVEKSPDELNDQTTTELPTKKLNWDMSRGNWSGADFSGLKGLYEKFSSSNMKNCSFIGSELSGLLLRANNMYGCDFRGSELNKSRFQVSNIANDLFNDCQFKAAEFFGSNIKNCDFSGADLSDSKFKKCALTQNNMTYTVLNRVTFNASHIADTIFETTLEGCAFENCNFTKVTFQRSKLINTFFKGRNLKRIEFIDCQADRMTYEFLKNGKADLTGISLLTQ